MIVASKRVSFVTYFIFNRALKMKKTFLLIIVAICLFSCNQQKIQELHNEISELKELNKQLTDSLENNLKQQILHSSAIGFPSMYTSKVNELNEINFAFCLSSDQPFPEYDVYRIVNEDTNEKELILSKQNKASFSYPFTPKTPEDTTVLLLLEFNINGTKIEMPTTVQIPVE